MKKIIPLFLILVLLLGSLAPAAFALDGPTLNGQAAILVDLESGRILYEKSMSEQRAPASLTKIMTVLLVLEAADQGKVSLDDVVTAQADCRVGMEDDSSTVGIVPGMQVSLRELLYCAMLMSANESCNIMGAYIDGSIAAFVEHMNTKAASIGCRNTHFVNTNGLTAEGHYSSCYDLYLITREAMRYPLFMELCNTQSYEPSTGAINEGKTMHNSNALITTQSEYYGDRYLYQYASGVKTGYTRAAGYCLISTASKDGMNLLAVVMGCDGWYNAQSETYHNFTDSIALYEWAFANFSYQSIVTTDQVITTVPVRLAQDDATVQLHPQTAVTMLLPNETAAEAVTTEVTVYEDRLVAPLEPGTVLGEAKVFVNGTQYDSVRLVNHSEVELARGEYMKARIREFFSNGWVVAVTLLVLILAVGYLVLVTRYRRLRRRHLKERKLAEQRRREARERQAQQAEYFSEDWKEIP